MNGEIVSGSSGATGPSAFQFFVRPLLTDIACARDVVRLYRTAIEFASCGQSVVVSLSRYIPALGSQKTSLNRCFRAVAFVAQADESEVSFTCEARSEAVTNTCAGSETGAVLWSVAIPVPGTKARYPPH